MRTLILLSLLFSSLSEANEIDYVWNGSPVLLELPLGVEQRIDFPEPLADLQVPDHVRTVSEITLSPKGVLLINITEPVIKERLFATTLLGRVYILDLTVHSDYESKKITILDPEIEAEKRRAERAGAPNIPLFLQSESSRALPDNLPARYVQLSRFALSHHIGPERLIPDLANAVSVDIKPVSLDRFVRLNAAIKVSPLLQWRIGAYYVTTLESENTGETTYEFDARSLRGDFEFAATANLVLEPKIHHNKTVWALISKTPFSVAVDKETL